MFPQNVKPTARAYSVEAKQIFKWKAQIEAVKNTHPVCPVWAYMLQSAGSQWMMRVPYGGDPSAQGDHRTLPNQYVQQIRQPICQGKFQYTNV
jgi:hypothetical protein